MSKMLHRLALPLLSILFLPACNNKTDKKAGVAPDTSQQSVNTPPAEKGVRLICKNIGGDTLDNPQFDVLLWVDGKETKLKTVYACDTIPKASYEQYEIPADAIAARGGWWAGAGDYYYVILRDGKPIVFEGWQEEGQEDKGYHWKEMKLP